MCPDVFKSDDNDGRYNLSVDVYSVGAIVFELFSGKKFCYATNYDISQLNMDFTAEIADFVSVATEM